MYTLPTLPYGYTALAPVIGEEIMRLHHQKHHQTYVDKLNAALEDVTGETADIVELLKRLDDMPASVRQEIRDNGGGHYNHSLFWRVMSPNSGGQPSGELAIRLDEVHGSFRQFVDAFNEQALGVFGSGWAWLMPDMTIVTTLNQDNPIMTGGEEPLLGLDVWEHAYYLDYKNVRADYVRAWWDVVNWSEVEKRYTSAIISKRSTPL